MGRPFARINGKQMTTATSPTRQLPRAIAGRSSAAPEPILSLHDVTRRYGGVRAVADCSFAVAPGTIVGLIGPNGAGKTTLLNLISGFERPDDGTIRFAGRPLGRRRPHNLARHGLVRTFQTPRPLGAMSVLENVALAGQGQDGERIWTVWLRPGRVGRQEAALATEARAVLDLVGLAPMAEHDAATLSGGQKKLLELARALMLRPRLLLLDEPAAGVNRTLLRQIERAILARRAEGVTVLIVEHDLDFVARLCDRVVVLSGGAVLCEGPPEAIRRDPAVLAAYLGSQHR
jgi:ABC-type branched-subunit amino acid transport system ATPase component